MKRIPWEGERAPGHIPTADYADTMVEAMIVVWTFERSLYGSVLHLIPPDPWDENRVLCGQRVEFPGVFDGFEIAEPDLDNWPTTGCLRCKAAYARRLEPDAT